MSTSEDDKESRFSQIYLVPEKAIDDSERFRRRLLGYYNENLILEGHSLVTALTKELGVKINHYYGRDGFYHPNFQEFFETAPLRDVLDSMTVVTNYLKAKKHEISAVRWTEFVERVFREERMPYSVNENGAVRYFIDERFEQLHKETISDLALADIQAVALLVDEAFRCLSEVPPKSKEALRNIFEAMESFIKLSFDLHNNLSEKLISETVQPWLQAKYSQDSVAQSSAGRLMNGLEKWINAVHPYRHGQKAETIVEPPFDLAVALIGQGATYLRLMSKLKRSDA